MLDRQVVREFLEGELGRVYNKCTKRLVYEDKELIGLMKKLLDSAENENLNKGS